MADRLDKIIAEVARSTYGAAQSWGKNGRGGGLGASRGGISRGSAGYPVPDMLDPKERPELEEGEMPLAKSPVQDDPSKDPNVPFSDWIDEADSPKALPKGIAHLEDLKPDEFLSFLEKYRDLPLKGGLEVSEKVDGSARITFGADGAKIWTQSKNGPKRYNSEEYPDQPMFRALRHAHMALESKSSQIAKAMPKDTFFVAEVLYTKIPNAIEYGPNVIMIHGVHQGGRTLSDEESRKLAQQVIGVTGGKLSDGKDPWKFEYKRTIDPKEVMVDVKQEFKTLKDVYANLKQLEPNKLKAAGKPQYQAALENFKKVQQAVKDKLVGQLRKQKSAYGPEGGDVEGLVFRDLESGQLIKLVDKEYFTKLNKFLWFYREMLNKGAKIGDKWEFGIMQKFRNTIADNVLGASVAKTPGFVKMLQTKYGSGKFPANADTPEKRADFILGKYIKDEGLMKGDFVKNFQKETEKVRRDFEKLKKEWDSKKKGELSITAKGKQVKMDPLIKQRTDESFKEMEDFFKNIASALQSVGALRGELTKKVGLLKIMLGQGRFEKLAGAAPAEGEPAEESVIREAGSDADSFAATTPQKPASGFDKTSIRKTTPAATKKSASPASPSKGIDTATAQAIIKKNTDKLAKRGINARAARPLGQGTRGVAFDVGSNRVLKITNDGQEAVASFKLQEFALKHVAKFSDVFRFPDNPESPGAVYGILQEKLEPFPGMGKDPSGRDAGGEAADLNRAILAFNLQETLYHAGYDWDKTKEACQKKIWDKIGKDYPNWKSDEIDKKYAIEYATKMNKQWDVITKKVHIDQMVAELNSKGIKFHDYHAGNIMVRPNGDYVLIDIGYSKVAGGKEPPVLEKMMEALISVLGESGGARGIGGSMPNRFMGPSPARKQDEDDLGEQKPSFPDDRQEYVGVHGGPNPAENGELDRFAEAVLKRLTEGRADKVGVTIGRFQPFHAGHAAVIRSLASKFNKVIVLVAGNTPDKKNPFTFQTRLDLMKRSLPDVFSKLEIHKAEAGGKNTGFIPAIIDSIIKDKKSTVEADTAIEVLVGPDRAAEVKQQMDRARQYKEAGKGEMAFDPSMAIVRKLPGVKNDDDTDRISGTRVRQAIAAGDKNAFKKMMDPHLVSNPGQMEELFGKMKTELMQNAGGPKEGLNEKLDEVGGLEGLKGILLAHADGVMEKLKIDLRKAVQNYLGEGEMGAVFDLGGGKVLKVTTSTSEGPSAMKLKGKTLRHVTHVYDVFALSNRRDKNKPITCIVRDDLKKLPDTEFNELNGLVDLLRDEKVIQTTLRGDFAATMQACRQLQMAEIRRDLGLQGDAPADPNAVTSNKRELRAKTLTDQKMTELEARLRHYQIDMMMKDLKSVGVKFADYKGDAIRKRGPNYVLSDFGGGGAAGAQPPLIEKVIESILKEIGITLTPGSGPGQTQSGLRAGSSGWSSPQGMYTDVDVATASDDPDEFELWSDKLPRIQREGYATGELTEELRHLMEATAAKTADRPSNKFEHLVTSALKKAGVDAKSVGGNDPKKADVQVTYRGKTAFIEAKYLEGGGANLVSARMKLVDGKWQAAGPETGFTAGIAKDLAKNANAQKFVKELHTFVAKRRKANGEPVPKAISMPATGKHADVIARNPSLVTPDEMEEFMKTRDNRYIYLDTDAQDVQKLVTAHYKYKNAPYMQFGDDFYLLGDDDPFGFAKQGVKQFNVTQGRKGVRVAGRTGRYEIIPELKAQRVFQSAFSLVNPEKKNPFKK